MHGTGLQGRQFQFDAIDAVAALLANSIVRLFKNNVVPAAGTPISAFERASFSGYEDLEVVAWADRGVDPDGVAYVTSDVLHWEATDALVPNTIYGAWVEATPALNGTITGATNATPIEITDVAHGLSTGDVVSISGVTGNTAANGLWTVTVTGADTFTLNGSVGNGAYVAGGTWTQVAEFFAMAGKFAETVAIQIAGDAVNLVLKMRADGKLILLLAGDF